MLWCCLLLFCSANAQTATDDSGRTVIPPEASVQECQHFSVVRSTIGVRLKWQTTQSEQIDHFEMEHSKDGRKWRVLGNMELMEQDTLMQRFVFVHTSPSKGDHFYRIRTVNRDGSKRYSAIRSLQDVVHEPLSVVPDPSKDRLTVLGAGPGTVISLSDVDGQLLLKQKASGSGTDAIRMSGIAAGQYQLTVTGSNGEIILLKMMKQ